MAAGASTAICVQAERWIPNDGVGNVVLEVTDTAGVSFQAGCPNPSQFVTPNRTRASPFLCNVVECVGWACGKKGSAWSGIVMVTG